MCVMVDLCDPKRSVGGSPSRTDQVWHPALGVNGGLWHDDIKFDRSGSTTRRFRTGLPRSRAFWESCRLTSNMNQVSFWPTATMLLFTAVISDGAQNPWWLSISSVSPMARSSSTGMSCRKKSQQRKAPMAIACSRVSSRSAGHEARSMNSVRRGASKIQAKSGDCMSPHGYTPFTPEPENPLD